MIYSKELVSHILTRVNFPLTEDGSDAKFVADELQRYGKIRQAVIDSRKAERAECIRHEEVMETIKEALAGVQGVCDHPCSTAVTGGRPGESYSECDICCKRL